MKTKPYSCSPCKDCCSFQGINVKWLCLLVVIFFFSFFHPTNWRMDITLHISMLHNTIGFVILDNSILLSNCICIGFNNVVASDKTDANNEEKKKYGKNESGTATALSNEIWMKAHICRMIIIEWWWKSLQIADAFQPFNIISMGFGVWCATLWICEW